MKSRWLWWLPVVFHLCLVGVGTWLVSTNRYFTGLFMMTAGATTAIFREWLWTEDRKYLLLWVESLKKFRGFSFRQD
jgi:hypothetical protein